MARREHKWEDTTARYVTFSVCITVPRNTSKKKRQQIAEGAHNAIWASLPNDGDFYVEIDSEG